MSRTWRESHQQSPEAVILRRKDLASSAEDDDEEPLANGEIIGLFTRLLNAKGPEFGVRFAQILEEDGVVTLAVTEGDLEFLE
jgi:hypothetical protein